MGWRAPTSQGAETAGHRAQGVHRQAGDAGERDDRDAERPELAGVERHAIEDQRGDHDPADGEEPECGAVDHRGAGPRDRHAVDGERQDERHAERAEPCDSARLAADAEHVEEEEEPGAVSSARTPPRVAARPQPIESKWFS